MLTKKQISSIVIFFVILSCITILSFDIDKEMKVLNVNNKILSTDIADMSYEALVFQDKLSQNRYRERSSRIKISDKIATLLVFCVANNIDKSFYNSILRNSSDVYLTHDTILLYIHNKDGKKQLL